MRCREGVAEVSRGVVGCRGGVVGCREGVAEVSRGVAEVSWCVDRPSTQINALTCLTILTRLSVTPGPDAQLNEATDQSTDQHGRVLTCHLTD